MNKSLVLGIVVLRSPEAYWQRRMEFRPHVVPVWSQEGAAGRQ